MSPEQIRRPRSIDQRSDIYSAGIVLYEMLTGSVPFDGDTDFSVKEQQINKAPPDPRTKNPAISSTLAQCVQKAMAKEPEKRYQTCAEFLAGIDAYQAQASGAKVTPAKSGLATALASKRKKMRPSSRRARDKARALDTEPTPQPSGRYRILEKIGGGRVGPLYKAYDVVDDRVVALKVISPHASISETERARFFRAGKTWKRLNHDNVVKIYDLDLKGDHGHIVMEFVPGEELRRLMECRQSLSLEDKLRLMAQICNGLHYVHQQGILHRDIRPSNIILTPDRQIKILDSGIARMAVPEERLTVIGEIIVGDQKYIAPEQAKGNSDYRTDVFSVGAVCCDLLTYQIPKGFDPVQRLAYMESMGPLIPPQLKAVLGRALNEDPNLRFTDLGSMASELHAFLRGLVGERQSPRALESGSRRLKIVFTLHGIRTHAAWQRAFSEIAVTTHR